jgi:phosphate transport system substrate-binding protein
MSLLILMPFIAYGYPIQRDVSISASSELRDSQGYYPAQNLTDYSWRSWAEGVSGNGIGEHFTLTMDYSGTIAGFALKNGYGNLDHYAENNRVKAFRIYIDGNYSETIDIKDSISFEQYSFSSPVKCNSVRFVIDEVYPGTAYNDTCIAEIALLNEIQEENIFYSNILKLLGRDPYESFYETNRQDMAFVSDSDGLLIWDYLPFQLSDDMNIGRWAAWDHTNGSVRKTRIALLDNPSSLRLENNLPRIDGATAMYPIYSSFVHAVYPEVFPTHDQNLEEWQYFPHASFWDDGVFYEVANSIVQCNTTPTAYQRLIDGEVDIVFCYEPSEAERQAASAAGKTFTLTPIARDAFVFIVNEKNSLSNITQSQIRDIYSGRVTNWENISGVNQPVIAYQRPENSGSQTILQAIMRGDTLMRPILEGEFLPGGMEAILNMVASDFYNYNSAIGFSFLFFINQMASNPGIKPLSIDGIAPNRQNIQNNRYPFAQTVYAVTTGNETENTRKLIEWILSVEGQELVAKTGYTPLR